MSDPATRATGRRSAVRRAVSPTALLAVLLPLLTVGALSLVRPDEPEQVARPAEQVAPSRTDLVCPPGEGDDPLALAAAAGAGGEATTRLPEEAEPTPVELRQDAVTELDEQEPVMVRGTGELAAQLIGARSREEGLAATDCVLPRPDYWFTGVGAGATHSSTLELANPDQGPAVADVTVWTSTGEVDAPTLRGVTVPGGTSESLDLSEVVPRRGELAVHVEISRGRLGATVVDEIPEIGPDERVAGWLPASPEPSTDQLLLGLVGGDGEDTLVLSNPGADEARVGLRVVTEDASFVPEGLEDVRVRGGSVETVTLSSTVREQVRAGAIGLQVVSTHPVTSTLRSVVDGDLVHAQPVAASDAATTALVPAGDAHVVLGRAGGSGVAGVAAYDADGKRLDQQKVELSDGSGGVVDLPRGTALVRVSPQRTDVAAAVVVKGDGATVVPLQALVRYGLVPDVRPGLPD
jgi:hypothetical protein